MTQDDVKKKVLEGILDVSLRNRVDWITTKLNPCKDDVVFDSGCGDGYYAGLLAEKWGAHIIGLEFDRDSLKRAQANTEGVSDQIDFVHGDAVNLPFKSGVFNKCIKTEVLEHIPDDTGALHELRRVMAARGAVAITVPNASYPFLWDPLNWLREHAGLGHFSSERHILGGIWTGHVRLYKEKELHNRLSEAGFTISHLERLTGLSFPFNHNILVIVKAILDSRWKKRGSQSGYGRFTPTPSGFSIIGIANSLIGIIWRFDRHRSPGRSVNLMALIIAPPKEDQL